MRALRFPTITTIWKALRGGPTLQTKTTVFLEGAGPIKRALGCRAAALREVSLDFVLQTRDDVTSVVALGLSTAMLTFTFTATRHELKVQHTRTPQSGTPTP